MALLRNQIDHTNINQINIEIAAYQIVIDFFNDLKEKHPNYHYIDERLTKLYSASAEYMIARELAQENIKNPI